MDNAIRIPPETAIQAFWDWFAGIASELALNHPDRDLLAALDEQISRLGNITWEVGPGQREPLAIVISPDGKKEWLAVTRLIAGLAPTLPGWEVHPARPPKVWNLQFSIETDSRDVHYDARPWRYVLSKFPDGSFDITVEQNNVAADALSYTAATIVVDSLLGEETRLRLFGGIEPVHSLATELATDASPITVLASHMRSLARP